MSSHMTSRDGKKKPTLEEWSSLIGIVTAICGNVLISFALNIQRYAHIRLERERRRKNQAWSNGEREGQKHRDYGTQQNAIAEERAQLNLQTSYSDREGHTNGEGERQRGDEEGDKRDGDISLHSNQSDTGSGVHGEPERKNYLKSPFWWLGLVLMTTGEAGNFLAYGFAPASTVSPLGVVALISNCIIAPCLLKERFRQRDFWGVLIAIAGAVVIVYSAKTSETKMGPDDIWTAITRWEFETYLGITIALIIGLMWASGKYGERTILVDIGLVALFGGYTALSTKGVASLLSDSLWRVLTFPITYLLIVVLILSALAQIRYINRALQRFDSTQVIPTQFVLFTISVIVGSAILYRDFKSATGATLGEFVGGCILTFLGVYLITSGRRRNVEYDRKAIGPESDGPIQLVDEEQYQDDVEEVPSVSTPKASRQSRQHSAVSDPVSPRLDGTVHSRSQSTTSSSPPVPPNPDLLSNPWRKAGDIRATRPLPLEGSISSPVLPIQARQSSGLLTPDQEEEEALSDGPTLQPTTTLPETPTYTNRASLSRRLTPGPYLSPLSSPLSALVADSIRRGVDTPSSRYRRPRLAGMRKSRSTRDATRSTEDIIDDSALDPDSALAAPSTPLRGERRHRSLSQTLGDLFRSRRDRRTEQGQGEEGEVERGEERAEPRD